MTNPLDELLTSEQQALLARHLAERMSAGFGLVSLKVERHQVRWIGQTFYDDAGPNGAHELPDLAGPSVLAGKRRR